MTVCKKGLRLIFFAIAIACIPRAAYGGDGPSGSGASLGNFETVPISNVTLITPSGSNVAHTTPTTWTPSLLEAVLQETIKEAVLSLPLEYVGYALRGIPYVNVAIFIIELALPKTAISE